MRGYYIHIYTRKYILSFLNSKNSNDFLIYKCSDRSIEVCLPALLRYYDKPIDQQTDRHGQKGSYTLNNDFFSHQELHDLQHNSFKLLLIHFKSIKGSLVVRTLAAKKLSHPIMNVSFKLQGDSYSLSDLLVYKSKWTPCMLFCLQRSYSMCTYK